jgi:hypothetical protein
MRRFLSAVHAHARGVGIETPRRRSTFHIVALVGILVPILALAAQTARAGNERHVHVPLVAEPGSKIHGQVDLMALEGGGTRIKVVAQGLEPGEHYVSLYYDNHICELEPYDEDDVIGGEYTANAGGIGTATGEADDDLDEINSVSVRLASDFSLLACADVHPTSNHGSGH